MSTARITANVKAAQSISAYPSDLWDAEWRYSLSLGHHALPAIRILEETDSQNLI